MQAENKDTQELATIIHDTGEKLSSEHYERFAKILYDLGIGYPQDTVPLEVWKGIAQAVADASGYHLLLQAAVLEPEEAESGTLRIIGQRTVATVEPMIFVTEA